MPSSSRLFSQIEPLEARIAPAAVVINNQIPNIVAGIGKTGASIDLSQLTAATSSKAFHTTVEIVTSYDTDLNTPGIQPGVIKIELFDDAAPLTVQNFLAYVNNVNAKGDYDGTFFHRAVSGFVLQGGGYEAATPTTHIPVFPTVHNEANIVTRSNTEGTVAMAKVGGDPNSATSEWFVNLADNSANLDAQNGGFTVFGKVDAASLALAKTITSLPLANVGLGATTPEQNGQVIKITDVKVMHPASSSTTGLTYTIESIVQTGTTTPSNLLTAKVTNSTLALNYIAGRAGKADVTVKVSDGTTSATDTFTVDVRPNLIAKIDSETLPFFLVPGDTTTVKFHVTNNGAGSALGLADIKLRLAKLTPTTDSSGVSLDLPDNPDAPVLATLSNVNLSIASGASQFFSKVVQLPNTLAGSADEYYRILVEVVPKTGTAANERYTDTSTASTLDLDDNFSLNGQSHQLVNNFGTFAVTHTIDGVTKTDVRTNAVLKYTTAAHPGLITWAMKGSGFGSVTAGGTALQTMDTTIASTVTATVAAGGAHVALNSLNLASPVGTAALGSVDVNGLIAVSGGIKTLALGDLTGEALLVIGAVLPDNTVKAAITLGNVTDFSIESDMPLASLTAKFWHNTPGSAQDSITAPSLGTLKVAGSFESDIHLTDELSTTAIAVTGVVRNATIETAGNFSTVALGGITTSNVFAGVSALPTTLADFDTPRTIQSFIITGIKGFSGNVFLNSQIAAQTIGTIRVTGINELGGGDYGFVADVIKSYSRTASTGHPAVTRSNLITPQTFDDFGHYAVTVL